MDYDAIDREMSKYCVVCTKNGTRFFLTDDGTASDIPGRAARFSFRNEAEKTAQLANANKAWEGFSWNVITRAMLYS